MSLWEWTLGGDFGFFGFFGDFGVLGDFGIFDGLTFFGRFVFFEGLRLICFWGFKKPVCLHTLSEEKLDGDGSISHWFTFTGYFIWQYLQFDLKKSRTSSCSITICNYFDWRPSSIFTSQYHSASFVLPKTTEDHQWIHCRTVFNLKYTLTHKFD